MPEQHHDLRRIVLDSIAAAATAPPGTITEDTPIGELDLDSLDFSTILIEIEDRLDAEVPAEVLDRLASVEQVDTVGDVLALLSRWNVRAIGVG